MQEWADPAGHPGRSLAIWFASMSISKISNRIDATYPASYGLPHQRGISVCLPDKPPMKGAWLVAAGTRKARPATRASVARMMSADSSAEGRWDRLLGGLSIHGGDGSNNDELDDEGDGQ